MKGSADADTMAGDRNTPKAASEELPSRDWEAEIAEWQDKYLRLQAEFDNFRKRTLREKMEPGAERKRRVREEFPASDGRFAAGVGSDREEQ